MPSVKKLINDSQELLTTIADLEDENINYSSKVPIWTDSGRILPFQQRTETETIELFDNCCTNEVYTLLHGKLYRCPFSANADNLKAIPHNEDDFIDITNYKNI